MYVCVGWGGGEGGGGRGHQSRFATRCLFARESVFSAAVSRVT